MAHNLETIDNKVAMAFRENGGLPWHGLGVALPDEATPQEMMKAASLDWKVEKSENFIQRGGEFVPTGNFSLVRETDGKVLTQVSEGWEPVQNEQAFEFFNDFVEKGDMQMESAGSLYDGSIVWAQANLKDGFEILGGDKVDGYLLFSNPHRYGKTVTIKFCATRVVCNNTLTLALNSKGLREVKVNHTRKFDEGKVKELMGLADIQMGRFKEAAEFLASVKVDADMIDEFYGDLFGVDENKQLKRNGLIAKAALSHQPGLEYAEGSMWQLFNSVTYSTNHVFGRKADNRMDSLWYGNAEKLNTQALNKALEMASKAA